MFSQSVCRVFTAALAMCLASASARQPNVILIMADDLGYETLGCNGGESYQTPELDKLAAAGMRLDNCFVQPLCTPTRIELMTGQSNVRNYIAFGMIDPNATTFAHLFRRAGYATAIAGKWQLGRDKNLPKRLGFDESCLWQHMRRPSRYANPGLEYNGQERDFSNGEYGPDLVNKFALDFITRQKDKPFLLYYSMMLTHAPYQPTPDSDEWDPAFDGAERRKDPKFFADMVAYMDKLVGRIAAKIDELGLRDDTLIIFLGDNGTGRDIISRHNGQAYPGGKGLTNARGMHVPLVINWRGRVPAGRVNGDLVSSVDFFPTICEAAGIMPPAEVKLDGESFLAQAQGAKTAPREPLYFWYSKDGSQERKVEFAMTQSHKLYANGRFADLTKDPFEEAEPPREQELAGENAAIAKQLREVLDKYEGARPEELRRQTVERQPRRNRAGRRAKRQGQQPRERIDAAD